MSSTPQWNLIRLMLYSALVATVYSTCEAPLNLPFAEHDGTKDIYAEGDTVTYSCVEGFIINPSISSISTCGPDSEWSAVPPELCRGICEEPLNLPFAVHDGTKDIYVEGDTVTYSCVEGFITNSSISSISTCGPDRKWSSIPPELCRRICPQPENLTNAVPNIDKTVYKEGDNVIYSCLPEYKYIPPKNNASTCRVNGTWSPLEDDFCAELQCGIPDILENGNVEFQDSLFRSIASYTCLKGYKLFGDDKRQCLENEKWNGTVPLCNRTCSAPPKLQFAKIDTSPADGYYPQSTQVTYTCISGFQANISLPSITTCQSDFTWREIPEFCMRKSCGSPGTLENGKVVMENDKFESKAEFVCDEGYMLVGDEYRVCLEDGAWNGSVPTCHRSCPNPPTLNSSEIDWKSDIGYFPVGTIVIYKCRPGYKTDQLLPLIIQCLEGLTWSNNTELCTKISCGNLEKIKNGDFKTTGTDFESVVTYSCNPGFTLIGDSERKCTEDGVWGGRAPECK